MMANQMGFGGGAAMGEMSKDASNADRIPGQSGVYSNIGPRRALVLSRTWEDDGDDEITAVWTLKASENAGHTFVPSTVPPQPKQASWQVAMVLHGDELTRLWTRESESMWGRMFVWSDYSESWVPLHSPPDIHSPVTPIPSNDWGWQDDAAPLAAVAPVDLTSEAHALKRTLTREHAGWIAATTMALALIATLSFRAGGNDKVAHQPPTKANAELVVQRSSTAATQAQAALPAPEIIPVDALPLIGSLEASAAPARKTRPTTARSANATHGKTAHLAPSSTTQTTRAFDPNLARLAIERAFGRTLHCARGSLSGTVLIAFQPSGVVKNVSLSALAGDVSNAQCVVSAFSATRVPPFKGGDVVVKKSFRIGG